MKTKHLLTILVSCFINLVALNAQIPQGFNYQAVAKDGNNPIANQLLPVRISVMADSLGASILWQELHSSVSTNGSGLFTLILGRGSRQPASTVTSFSDIDWSIYPRFIRTEINYNGWKTMGISRLWSVPYSMNTANITGTLGKLSVKGRTALNDEALFEVKNKDGQTIFAVYNEGVRVYVSDGAKGLKGGFAVGGFGTDKAASTPYFIVGKDSVRVYLDTNPLTKGLKGGFAVGGYDLTKGPVQNYLDVSSDSVRIYIDSNPSTKKVKGGFAVGGYDMTKGAGTNYMNVNPDTSNFINPSQNRIYWYPLKNAFLTGRVLIERPDSVGTNSFASGYESKAKGKWSQALGYKAIARGDYSTAIGKNATSNKMNSFAFGENAQALNIQTYALGYSTKASGLGSFAMGYNARTTGQDAFALGSGTEASGTGSYAFGFIGRDSAGMATGNTKASGDWSVAIGMGAQAKMKGALSIGTKTFAENEFSLAIGYNAQAKWANATAIGSSTTASGNGSVAIGYYSNATNHYSYALGFNVNATANSSTAIGTGNTASGVFSTALGTGSLASGNSSTVMGEKNTASGLRSTAMGYMSVASQALSTAIGWNALASGYGATSIGVGTTAQALYSTVVGSYNVVLGTWNSWDVREPIFVVGNGSSNTARSSALTIIKSGNTGIGQPYPESRLDILGGRWNTASSEGDFRIGNAAYRLKIGVAIDGGGAGDSRINAVGGTNRIILGGGAQDVMIINNSDVLPYYDNISSLGSTTARWKTVYSVNGVIQTSDARMKEVISPVNNGLDLVLQLKPVSFYWKSTFEKQKQLGLIAQEVLPYVPEVVYTGDGIDSLMGINYSGLVPVLISAIQEQQKQIKSYKSENDNLKSQLLSLQEKVEKIEAMLGKDGGN